MKQANSNNYLELTMNINISLHLLNKQQLELSIHQWCNQSTAFTMMKRNNLSKAVEKLSLSINNK